MIIVIDSLFKPYKTSAGKGGWPGRGNKSGTGTNRIKIRYTAVTA
jgi:hypothetical protein